MLYFNEDRNWFDSIQISTFEIQEIMQRTLDASKNLGWWWNYEYTDCLIWENACSQLAPIKNYRTKLCAMLTPKLYLFCLFFPWPSLTITNIKALYTNKAELSKRCFPPSFALGYECDRAALIFLDQQEIESWIQGQPRH